MTSENFGRRKNDPEKGKVTDRIRKDLGNIQGLADSIKKYGLINPPVVTLDTFELIAGERRLRALKLLGYKEIEVSIMTVENAEHQFNIEIEENEERLDFSKLERLDYARELERIEKVKAQERMTSGGNQYSSPVENFPHPSHDGKTRDIVASKLDIGSGRQYEKEKFIVDNKSSLPPQDFADWNEGKLL